MPRASTASRWGICNPACSLSVSGGAHRGRTVLVPRWGGPGPTEGVSRHARAGGFACRETAPSRARVGPGSRSPGRLGARAREWEWDRAPGSRWNRGAG